MCIIGCSDFLTKTFQVIACKISHLFLPPAYIVRREGNSFTLLACPHLGGGGRSSRGGGQSSRGGVSPARGGVSQPGGGGGQPAGGGGSAKIGQQNEYSLHGRRYASCVHAGGLSCFAKRLKRE